MAIDEQILLAAIDAGRENSYGTDENSDLGSKRTEAIEAYLGLNTNPAPEGRSQVVDRSVYETISTLMPSLVRIFSSSSDEICKFQPVGSDDELAAEQTTAVISHVVTQLNPWEQICSDWIHDAALLSNGYAMAYWDESDVMIREPYDGQSDDQVASIVQDQGVKVIQHTAYPDKEGNAQAAKAYEMALQQWNQHVQMGHQMPQPQPPQPQMLHDLVIERRENEGKVCISVLPPEHCYVSVDTPNWMLKECPYFEYRQQKTIADLRAMGLEVPEDVSDDDEWDSDEDDARDRFSENRFGDNSPGVMRLVWTRMIWVRADAEGDGVSRLYYVIAVGRTILFSEPCTRIPVSSMTPHPLPHRHIGLSLAETVLDLQEIKTAVKRGGLDNLYLMNAGRHVISSKVNLADFLDARAGGVVRMLDESLPGEGHILPLVHPVAFEQVISSLEYFDQERQNRTGVMRGAAGLEANAMNRAAVGTTQAMQSHAAQRTEHIARTMAPAIEYLFDIVQEIVAKHRNKPLTLKLKGNWVTVDPQAWRTKRDVKISVGVGAGNKESMQQHLQMVLANQMQVGLPMNLVGRDNIRATNVEVLKLAGFANPDKFWPDPKTLPPPQPQPTPEQVKAQAAMQELQFKYQQDAMKFQAEQQNEQMKLQMQAELDRNREEMDARQKMLESQQKSELEQQKALIQAQQDQARLEFERWKTELDAAVKLQIASMSGDVARETSAPKEDSRIEEVIQTMEALKQEYESPAELIRDQNGKAVSVKRGDRVRQVVRGPDGRAIGLQ
jgi:hypothetical protein